MIKLVKELFQGTGYISQLFANKLYINGVDIYAQYGLLGHNGIDYAIPNGRELYACIDGIVKEARRDSANNYSGGYGLYIKLENDYCGIIYAHMMTLNVEVGDVVSAGHILGLSDNTGNSTGAHLHFGVHPVPRDRNNGYNGYISPFDSTKVMWVDSLEKEIPDGNIGSPSDKTEVVDTVNVQIKISEEEREVSKNLLKTIVEFITKLWKAIVSIIKNDKGV